jgi:hypothetical protein
MSRDEAGKFSSGGGGSPAAVHSRVKQIYDKRKAQYKALKGRIAALQSEEEKAFEAVKPLHDKVWDHLGTPAEREAYQVELNRAYDEVVKPKSDAMWAAIHEVQGLRDEGRKEIFAAIGQSARHEVDLAPDEGIALEMTEGLTVGSEWFGSMVDVDVSSHSPVSVRILEPGGRAGAGGNGFSVTRGDGPEKVVHELGHVLEDRDPEVHRAAVDFLTSRTAGEPDVRLADLYPGRGYGADEITKPDRFIDPYMGKQYRSSDIGVTPELAADPSKDHYSTEIVSQGLQRVYETPGELAARDPEYFKFIVGVMRGSKK